MVVDDSGLNVCDAYPEKASNISRVWQMDPSPLITQINEEYQSELPAPWKYYNLMNTLQPDDEGECCVLPTGAKVNACYMTNTTMESYTQYFDLDFTKCQPSPSTSMNCTDCHAAGVPYGAPVDAEGFPIPSAGNPTGGDYQVFTFLLFAAGTLCPADLNADDVVNGADLGILLHWWGTGWSAADLNGDFAVDGGDLGILISAWGACPTP